MQPILSIMFVDFSSISEHAKIWIYPSSRKFYDTETAEIEKAEVEEYIDGRLATLEVILNKTMDAVSRGRDRLAGANDKDVLSQLADEN